MDKLKFWRRKAALVYPVPPPPPTAVLQPGFRSSGVVRVFPHGWDAASAAFAPAAIAGSWAQIESLIPEKIPSLTHALIVLARPGEPQLSKAQRDKLWRVFRVPLFEQIVDERGTLLAAECEAHDGLHIQSSEFLSAEQVLDYSRCGCGRDSPRLKREEARTVDPVRSLAAYAR